MGLECGGAREVGPTVVEVWAQYGRRVLDVRHLGGSGDPASDSYTIGESHDVALVVPPAGLPSGPTFTLVRGRMLYFTESMRGDVDCAGATFTLRELIRHGHATVCGSAYRYPLEVGTRCRVEHNAVTFLVNVVPAEAPLRLSLQCSRPVWTSTARAFVLFASVLVPASFATRSTGQADVEVDGRLSSEAAFAFSGPPAPEEPESTRALEQGRTATAQRAGTPQGQDGGNGRSLRGEVGDSGGPEARDGGADRAASGESFGEGGGEGEGRGRGSDSGRHERAPPPLPAPDERPRGEGEPGAASATPPRQNGVPRQGGELGRWVNLDHSALCPKLDLLALEANSHTRPSMLMRVGRCEVPDPGGIPQMARNFDPDMMSRNAGILAMMQRQDGHFLGSLHDRSFAVGDETEDVWGGLAGPRVGGAHTGPRARAAPRIRQAKAQIQGELDPDIIRRIARAHIHEVRSCYVKGLATRPRIRGRVAIRFSIQPNGRVSTSRVWRSSLNDERVEKCISARVRRWKFPKPQDGRKVVVTYPFVLERS